MEIERRRHLLGIIGFVAVLASAGTATAIDLPLPKRKPAITGNGVALTSFITSVRPARKPGPAPRPQTLAAAIGAAKDGEADRIIAALGGAPVAASPVLSQAANQNEEARLSPAVFQKQPSLLDRVFTHLGSPRDISDEDAARYGHIFAFQDVGQFVRANAEIEKLSDLRLLGHVLLQRYTSATYKTTAKELADWMKAYADHPGAQKIYDLAKKRNAGAVAPPRTGRGVYGMHDFDVGQLAQPYIRERNPTPKQKDVIRAIGNSVSSSPTSSLARLEKNRDILHPTQYDALQADIAASYFYNGKTEKAYELAVQSAGRSGKDVPHAGWIGGLSAWQLGKYSEAARLFEITAKSNRTSAWMASAGAYWAARSYLRSREPQNVNLWLRRAAEYPRTFYGLIAMKALGMQQGRFNWQVPVMADKHAKALLQLPAGRRALALVKAERPDLAEQELGQINPAGNDVLQEGMIALAAESGMPGLALRMGSAFKTKGGKLYDAALYPEVPWEPAQGFSVDRALVYAFIRQESRFQSNASNRSSGAVGLMQLMPTTAKHVAKQHGDRIEHEKLQDPTLNIDLGQKYISELLRNDKVGNNLFKLAVAYNAGPGKLARWEQNKHYASDPLLFIEAIPVAETRIFVERVMTNFWIYRMKYEQDTESLDLVAEGSWPAYAAQDRRGNTLLAAAERFFKSQ